MWVIPSQIQESLPFAQEYVVSKEDLSELSEELESSLMWRSKHSSLKTYSARWNTVFWLPRLFGRMLRPSTESRFVDWWTASWEGTRVSPSPLQDKEAAQTTPDTFTRLFQELSKQQDLFGASLKTSLDTSLLDSPKYRQTYDLWVTQLRQEYIQRKKLAHHIRENGSSSSQSEMNMWRTPQNSETEGGTMEIREGANGRLKLRDQVASKWPTPKNRDYKADGNHNQTNNRPLNEVVERIGGRQDREKPNTRGKKLVLNPRWVLQLMGTTLEKTFFVAPVTQLSRKQQK